MKRKIFQDLLRKHGLGKLKDELAKYLTEQRKSKIEKVLKVRISSIEIAFESPIDIHNALASFRTIEAFGLIGVHVINAIFKRCKGKKTTQGAHHWVNLNYHNSLQDFLDKNDCFFHRNVVYQNRNFH